MPNTYQDPYMRKTLARFVRAQMELAGLTYKDLCHQLESKYQIQHNPDTLRNKISSGAVGAQMFLFIMFCLELDNVYIKDLERIYSKLKGEA